MESAECVSIITSNGIAPPVNDQEAEVLPSKLESCAELGLQTGTCEKILESEKKAKSNSLPSEKQAESSSVKQNNSKQSDATTKKSSREEKYSRRKDERSIEQVLRALNGLDSPQDKLTALCKKYADIIEENRKLQTQVKNVERRLGQVEREKDSAQSEYSKAVLTRSRLEGLCRELQRQNKAIKDESLLRIREEEEKRKDVSNKFQSTLAEITTLMQQNNEKNTKLRDYNIEMTTKLKSVCEQYELRVQQVEKISKQMQLEAQLADAKLAKARMEAAAEKEGLLREKQELLVELAQYQTMCQELQQTEIELRSQIDLYTSKYDEFQNALSRSNQVFGGFKGEMDKMSKKIVKLEKETSTWKSRWEKSHQALLEMAADKQQRDAELALANRQSTQLHKLCRTLTEERAKLMSQLNSNNSILDPEKKEKEAVELAEDRRKLNDTLDTLQAVLLERELLVKQQQLEKQQQELKAKLQEQQKSIPQEDSSSFAQPTTKISDKKKGKKHKNGRQAEEKPAPLVCKSQPPAPELNQCPLKVPLGECNAQNELCDEAKIASGTGDATEKMAETQSVEVLATDSDSNEKMAELSLVDESMPPLEPCEALIECEQTELIKPADESSHLELMNVQTSVPEPVVTPASFSYAAALGCKVHDVAIEKPAEDLKLAEVDVPVQPIDNGPLKENELEAVNLPAEISDKTILSKEENSSNDSNVTPSANNSSASNTNEPSGEPQCVQDASPVPKKGKEHARKKKK